MTVNFNLIPWDPEAYLVAADWYEENGFLIPKSIRDKILPFIPVKTGLNPFHNLGKVYVTVPDYNEDYENGSNYGYGAGEGSGPGNGLGVSNGDGFSPTGKCKKLR